MAWGNVLISLIYTQLASFPNTTFWRECLFPIVYSCLLWHRLIDHRFRFISGLSLLFHWSMPIPHHRDCCAKAPALLLTWCCRLNPKPPNAHSCPPRHMPKNSARVHWKMFIEMYMSAPVRTAPNQKQPRCPSRGEWINKLWQIPTAENHSAVIRNELLLTCKTRFGFQKYRTE